MIRKDDNLIVGSLKYGRILKKSQKVLLAFLIVLAFLLVILFSVCTFIFIERVVDKICFLVIALLYGLVLIVFPSVELISDRKNKEIIFRSIDYAVMLYATSSVLHRNWNGSVMLSVRFRYNSKRMYIKSNKHIKIGKEFQERTFPILYSPKENSVLFLRNENNRDI